MNIRHARPDDLNKIMEIYQYARTVMAQSGNPGQWVNGYPSRELIEGDLKKNACSFWKMRERSKRYLFILLGMNQIITR